MKKILCLLSLLMPCMAFAAPSKTAQEVCGIIDLYIEGSRHYFECLEHAESLKPELTKTQVIESICGAIDTFNGLNETHKERCLKDAHAKLADQSLTCWPEHNILYSKLPESFDDEAVTTFTDLTKATKTAYKAKVKNANNSVIADLHNTDGCLANAYAVSLDGPNPLKDAVKECVFTDINANPGKAITAEDREIIAAEFVATNWGSFRFRKLINATLLGDAVAPFNTKCVLEVRSPDYPEYKLYMSGYTHG